jgi:hypothetical protein
MRYAGHIFNYCRAAIGVSALNPAVWVCLALAFVLYADNRYEWLFASFGIGFSNFLILQTLAYRHYSNNAKAATEALRTAAKHYDISITSLRGLIETWKIELLDLYTPYIIVCRLRAKPGVKPLTCFKSYIMKAYSSIPSIIFFSANGKLTTFDRFYLLHEASHSTETAHALHHNMLSLEVRLLPIYLPLYVLANNWVTGILIVVIFFVQKKIEDNEPLLERETDWRAWLAYVEIYGREEAIAACKKLHGLFRMKERLDPSDYTNRKRADLLSKFCHQIEQNEIHPDEPMTVRLHSGGTAERISVPLSFLAGIVSLISACIFSTSTTSGAVSILGIAAIWIGNSSTLYFAKRFERQQEALRVAIDELRG